MVHQDTHTASRCHNTCYKNTS